MYVQRKFEVMSRQRTCNNNISYTYNQEASEHNATIKLLLIFFLIFMIKHNILWYDKY